MTSRTNQLTECAGCHDVLTGRKYIRHEGRPLCIPCFERDVAHRCAACEKLISADQKEVSFKETFYHDCCFSCSNCRSSLVQKPFAHKNGALICLGCYEKMPQSRCHECGVAFKNGQVTMEFAGKHWHEECFRCKHCRCIISTDRFVAQEDGQLCSSCFEKYFAPKCFRCNKAVLSGGVKVNGTPWHSQCFACFQCQRQLADSTFVSKGCDFYCDSCYNEKFVRKCKQCNKPVTESGDSRCVSFDGKTWHFGCFACCRCDKNLTEKGFVMADDQLMCPTCAQAN